MRGRQEKTGAEAGHWVTPALRDVDRTATWPPQVPSVETALEWKRAVREGDCNVIFGTFALWWVILVKLIIRVPGSDPFGTCNAWRPPAWWPVLAWGVPGRPVSTGSAAGWPLCAFCLRILERKHCPALYPAHLGITPQLNVHLGLDNKPDIQVRHNTFVDYFLHVG